MNARRIPLGLIGFAAVAISAGAAFLLVSPGSAPAGLLKPEDPAVVTRGGTIYAENCASCHGAELRGEPDWRSPREDGLFPAPPHDENGHTWHHSEKLLFELTKYGVAQASGQADYKTLMPIYDGVLSDEDIIAVLSFIKSRWPEQMQQRHTEMSAGDR